MNDAKIKITVVCFMILAAISSAADRAQTQKIYLSGTDKDRTVAWDFYCTQGRNSGLWTKIPVPSQWELQGFGVYNYGHDKNKSSEQGLYKKTFSIPAEWKDRRVLIVFEGVMTDTAVKINGQSAGPIHQGGFYRFEYDITPWVQFGNRKLNTLEVTVSKVSADPSVEDAERIADWWVFGGIYRPVYLLGVPAQYIDWTAIDAKADGTFYADVYLKHIAGADEVRAQITTLDGKPLGEPFQAVLSERKDKIALRAAVRGYQTWSAETPALYYVNFTLLEKNKPIHKIKERFGFRTIEVRQANGVYLNGQKIRLKGVNRHSFWPDSGRTLSRQICYDDVKLIKAMNCNAVRGHYPPDTDFLDACDELGLYVLDELAGWKTPYTTAAGTPLLREMLKRDVNHPSIAFWDNGNEGGWNTDLDDDFAIYDPQRRVVLHPWAVMSGIDTDHYETYASTQKKISGPHLFMTTEFLHGLYDGGGGAGLEDYWDVMGKAPLCAGGFLWAFLDEGAVRTDLNGKIDCMGNLAPDGVVGPHRQKEGSFYTIRDIWCPVQIPLKKLPEDFDGTVPVENHYDFTNLKNIVFRWELVRFHLPSDKKSGHRVLRSAKISAPAVEPGKSGTLSLSLPQDWKNADALYLTATDAHKQDVSTWTWAIKKPPQYRLEMVRDKPGKIQTEVKSSELVVSIERRRFYFNPADGTLLKIENGEKTIPLGGGPFLVPENPTASASPGSVTHGNKGEYYQIEAVNKTGLKQFVWRVYPSGWLSLEYAYSLSGYFPYYGISFTFPEQRVLGCKWLGQGPYRVWKNRLRGTTLDAWYNSYNNSIPGQTWEYPEFKGYFAGLNWMNLQTKDGNILIATDTDDLFFRLFTPESGDNPKFTKVEFPAGDISFLHTIAPIGNKFHSPAELGPKSQVNQADGIYKGVLYFRFY